MSAKFVCNLLIASAIVPLFAVQTFAQSSAAYRTPNSNYMPGRSQPQRRPEHSHAEWVTAPLKTAPQLPYLPEYRGSGTKFVEGTYTPNLRTATTYCMNFVCKEPPQQVKQAYENSLKGNGWTVKFYGKDESNMEARLASRGLTCTAVVGKTSQPGYKSSLAIRYIDRTKMSAQAGK